MLRKLFMLRNVFQKELTRNGSRERKTSQRKLSMLRKRMEIIHIKKHIAKGGKDLWMMVLEINFLLYW